MMFFKKPKKAEALPPNWDDWMPVIIEGSETEHYLKIHDPGMTMGNSVQILERCQALGLRQMTGCFGQTIKLSGPEAACRRRVALERMVGRHRNHIERN